MPLPQPELPHFIDSTMLNCFRACPQKFYLEFVRGLRSSSGVSIDLQAGAAIAAAIERIRHEVLFSKRDLELAKLYGLESFLSQWHYDPSNHTAKTFVNCWAAVEEYFLKFPPHSDHIQPYRDDLQKPTLEYTFAIPLEPITTTVEAGGFPAHPNGDPFLYTGRFDLLGRYGDRPCVLDEKTTGSSIGASWADRWDLRSQFIGYVWACRTSGIDLDLVIVRGISIQKTQIVIAEAVKLYSQHLVSLWYEQLRRDLWRLRHAWDTKYFDYNFGDSCISYGGCPYAVGCQSPNSEAWYATFQEFRWNPLARNPLKETEHV